MKDLAIEPDEQQVMEFLRADANAAASIDLKDQYLLVMKSGKAFAARKTGHRRFVPGHSAFKTMSHTPVLSQKAMITIRPAEREVCFRGVVASDRYSPGTAAAAD